MIPYFPVTPRYLVPGPVYSLGQPEAGTRCIEVDEDWPRYRAEKLAQRAQGQGPLRTAEMSASAERSVAMWLAAQVAEAIPGMQRIPASGPVSLADLLTGLQEDLVILTRDTGTHAASARAAYVDVCFPSGWCPDCAVGRDFLSLHGPVPTTGQFGPIARPQYANALFGDGIRVRYVWTVTPDDRLDRRSCHCDPPHAPAVVSDWATAERVFLRVERQVIVPIDPQTCAFLIRIHQHPVSELTDVQRATVLQALQSMPEAAATYKGLQRSRERIVALLS
jgi:hypothetical protein